MKVYICYIPDETSAELHNVAKECYLKSEADKVIAKLEEKLDTTEKWLNKALDCISNGKNHMMSLARKNNHANYKRCLAMAEKCESMCYWFSARFDHHELVDNVKWELFDRWRLRWAKLADKFKEAK